MTEGSKRYKIRPLRKSDEVYIWKWFMEEGWHGFGWTAWTLCSDLPLCRQWVTANENDRPISYIAISQQLWGQWVPAYMTAKKYRNQRIGWILWQETVGKMEKENVGLTATYDMLPKYINRSEIRHTSPVEIINFKGSMKSLPLGISNPTFQVYSIQDDQTIEKVISYDRRVFPTRQNDSRNEFLWAWLRKSRVTLWDPAPKILSLYAEDSLGNVVGYGSISPATGAAKIAPLYADTPEIAMILMSELLKIYNSTVLPIDRVILRVPNVKKEFIDFFTKCGFVESVTLKQGFTKSIPYVNYDRIFCIASHFCQLY